MAYIFQTDRYLLQKHISKYAEHIKGVVLDVGAGSFDRYRSYFKCEKYIRMDIKPGENIDIIGRVESIPFGDAELDSIVCTQVLGDVFELDTAMREFFRVLKPGGKILITESFIDHLHDEPNDYWRFTNHSLSKLLNGAGFKILIAEKRGGYFSVRSQMYMRYLIERYDLYNCRLRKLFSILFKCYGLFCIWLDNADKSRANKIYFNGWIIIAQKN